MSVHINRLKNKFYGFCKLLFSELILIKFKKKHEVNLNKCMTTMQSFWYNLK